MQLTDELPASPISPPVLLVPVTVALEEDWLTSPRGCDPRREPVQATPLTLPPETETFEMVAP